MCRRVIVSALIAIATSVSGLEVFPGATAEVKSPNGLQALVWLTPEGASSEQHRLCLRDASGSLSTIREFGRWVRVAWAPDSRHFAVIDGIGSDASESWVYSTARDEPLSVWDLLRAQHRDVVEPLVRNAHHEYVEADSWLDPQTLSVRLWGYGGAKPFDRRFRVRLLR